VTAHFGEAASHEDSGPIRVIAIERGRDTMSEPPITELFDAASGIARITFNRPEVLNALDVATAVAFREATERAVAHEGIRCIVLAGAGRAFVAGGDVASLAGDSAAVVNALLDALHPAILALRACPAPVLAVVQGAAAGAGLSLVLGADLVVAGEGARFLIAYDRIGASPDCGATWFLPRKVGRTRAFEMMLLGPVLDAEAARQAGIVSQVAPAADLERLADEIARRIASGPTRAYGRFKRLIDDAHAAPLADQLEAERRAFVDATETADFREGTQAFLGKREPAFRGA
jgi:2-(1,2-epoxy-1,2-dihydrophenyl)acetyl-CoA isomerase